MAKNQLITGVFQSIRKWIDEFLPYYLTYKRGFIEFENVSNSPQMMVHNYLKMPFMKHDEEHQIFTTNTPFIDVAMFYHSIENGLFLIKCDLHYKINFCAKQRIDPNVPAKHFYLSLQLENYFGSPKGMISWCIYKPDCEVKIKHYRNKRAKHIIIHFTKEWMENYLKMKQLGDDNSFYYFLQSELDYINFTNEQNEQKLLPMLENLENDIKPNKVSISNAKTEATQILDYFLSSFFSTLSKKNHFKLGNQDRAKILHIEQILHKNMYDKFPGIDQMADMVGCSKTKLKICFKTVHDRTIMEYFQYKQMEMAKYLVENSDLKIGEIAARFSYENTSKFAATFKDFNGILPSEMRKSFS
jgi:AraC-like DNA-binding protein